MSNDSTVDANRAKFGTAQPSPRRDPVAYLGSSAAARSVHVQLREAIASRAPVLLIGARGTGKRTIARLIAAHSESEIPLTELSTEQLDGIEMLPDLTYLCPLEVLSLGDQAGLPNRVGLGRLILATRLEPGSNGWRRHLDTGLLDWCSLHVHLPPLSSRIDDLDSLVTQILVRTRLSKPIAGLSDEALSALRRYAWPDNVNELEAVIAQAITVCKGPQIELWDLPATVRLRDVTRFDADIGDEFSLVHAERLAIIRALRQARGNKRKAARLLQIGKTTLYRKLAKYGVV